jgi:hypothetical protein
MLALLRRLAKVGSLNYKHSAPGGALLDQNGQLIMAMKPWERIE